MKKQDKKIFWFFLALAGIFLIPLWKEMVFGLLVSLVLVPIQVFLKKKLKISHNFSSTLTLIFFLVFVFLPLIFSFHTGIKQFSGATDNFKKFIETKELTDTIHPIMKDLDQKLGNPKTFNFTYWEIYHSIKSFQTWISKSLEDDYSKYLRGGIKFLQQFFLFLFFVGVFLFYHKKIFDWFRTTFPKYKNAIDNLFDTLKVASKSILYSVVLVGIVQGSLLTVGYLVAGFSNIAQLFILSVVLCMVPFVGAASCYGVAFIYLAIMQNQQTEGLLFLLYGILIVSTSDNLLRAFLIKGKSPVNPVIIFIFMLGGAMTIGSLGIFLGPIAYILLASFRDQMLSSQNQNTSESKA